MKAGLYLRVSTDAQTEKYSIPAQREMLEKYCDIRGYTAFRFYTDAGFSGSNINRPALNELCADCRAGLLDVVVVYKLDRLSRSQKDTLYLIEEVFIPSNVDFVSVSENFDTSTPFGKAMIGVLSVFAQLERETIRERTRMGMRERVKKGYWSGGGKTPFGYDYNPAKGILVKNANAPLVKQMYEMYIKGHSAQAIADYFGLKYDSSIMQILKCKANMGLIEHNGEVYAGLHEPIVSEETFRKAHELNEKRKRINLKGNANLLTGLVYCGRCGAKMRYQKWGKSGHKICCYSQQSDKTYLIKDPNCDNKKHWAFEIEDSVINELKKFSLDPKLLNEKKAVERINEEKKVKEERASLQKKIDRIIEFISEGGVAEGDARKKLNALCTRRDSLNRILSALANETQKTDTFRAEIKNLNAVWDELDFTQKRAIIIMLVKKVVITFDTVEIFYCFE